MCSSLFNKITKWFVFSIRDLLSKEHLTKRLELRERPDTGVYVKDLTSFVCKSRSEIEHVMNVGNVNRFVNGVNQKNLNLFMFLLLNSNNKESKKLSFISIYFLGLSALPTWTSTRLGPTPSSSSPSNALVRLNRFLLWKKKINRNQYHSQGFICHSKLLIICLVSSYMLNVCLKKTVLLR